MTNSTSTDPDTDVEHIPVVVSLSDIGDAPDESEDQTGGDEL